MVEHQHYDFDHRVTILKIPAETKIQDCKIGKCKFRKKVYICSYNGSYYLTKSRGWVLSANSLDVWYETKKEAKKMVSKYKRKLLQSPNRYKFDLCKWVKNHPKWIGEF